jgi:hypothetical protein
MLKTFLPKSEKIARSFWRKNQKNFRIDGSPADARKLHSVSARFIRRQAMMLSRHGSCDCHEPRQSRPLQRMWLEFAFQPRAVRPVVNLRESLHSEN